MSSFDHTRLINALKKVGATVTSNETQHAWTARKGDRAVSWYAQKDMDDAAKRTAVCLHTASPHTDAMTDCFCDTFYRTIKGAVQYLG